MGLFPRMTMLNTVNGADANSVCARYFGESLAIAEMVANLCNLLLGKFSLIVLRAALLCVIAMTSLVAQGTLIATLIRPPFSRLSSFCNHVGHVVGLASKPQVFGVNTARVVAHVQDIGSVRDRAVEEMVGYTMPHPDSLTIFDKFYGRISLSIRGMLPLPTPAFRYGVSCVKAFNEVFFTHNNRLVTGLNPSISKLGG